MITDHSGYCPASTLLFEGCLQEGVRFPFQRQGWQSDVWNRTRIPEGAALIRVMSATQTDKSWWPSNVPCTTTSGQVVREHGKCLRIPLPLKRSGLLANICAATQGRNRPKVKGEEKVKPHYSPDTKTREQFLGPADTGFICTKNATVIKIRRKYNYEIQGSLALSPEPRGVLIFSALQTEGASARSVGAGCVFLVAMSHVQCQSEGWLWPEPRGDSFRVNL